MLYLVIIFQINSLKNNWNLKYTQTFLYIIILKVLGR